MLVELEGSRILYHHLPDTLQKLCEDWRDIATLASKMATPAGERQGKEKRREKRREEGVGDEWSEGIRDRKRELLHCFPPLLHLCSFFPVS